MRWIRGLVSVNGSRYKTIRGWQAVVRLQGLPSGTFVLSITGVARGGQRATASRRFHRCGSHDAKSPRQGAAPAPTLGSPSAPSPAPPISPEPDPSRPEPGRYTVRNAGAYLYSFSFYVSPDGTRLEDVSGTPGGRCTPGGQFSDPFFYIAEIAIQPDGSFSATRTEQGVAQGAPATITFTFSGHFQAGGFAGSYREDLAYDNGVSYSCTSDAIAWTAVRDEQGSQAPSPAQPGRYTVRNAGAYLYSFSFYVSPDGTRLEDVSGTPGGRCTPGGQFSDPFFYIAEIAIQPDGSFSATRTEQGVAQGAPATITFTFSGHFHGSGSDGRGRAAGSLREEVVYTNGARYTCTSNTMPWSAVRDENMGQASAPPAPGSYSVGNAGPYHLGFSFDVSPDATRLLDVSGSTRGHCSPGGSSFSHQFLIAEIAIAGDGSFSATRSEAAQVSGHAATFTYTFSGHFHGYDSSGRALAAGVMRADLTYSNGATFTCSSNLVPWSAHSS